MKNKSNFDFGLLAIGSTLLIIYGAIIGIIFFIITKMFEYSLWCTIGKDIPWYGDLLGAILLNGVNFPVFGICLIARMCGVDIPFFEIK